MAKAPKKTTKVGEVAKPQTRKEYHAERNATARIHRNSNRFKGSGKK